MKQICHIDLNAFFVQVEILKNPALKGKPVAVGYDGRRGVISTSSYEARKFGVTSGIPVSMAKEKCPNLILVNSDFGTYARFSRSFISFLRRKFPILEQASIDECYLDVTGKIDDENAEEQLFDLQMDIYKNTSLKCSIGYSYNKFLAKMASDMKKPLGITILRKDDLPNKLWPLDISSMFGIGKKTFPRLKQLGIMTIGDLAMTNSEDVKSVLGSMFVYLKEEANGYADDVVDTSSFDPKSISAERTFSEDVMDFDDIRSMVNVCANDVYEEMSKYNKTSDTVLLKIRNNNFVTKSKRRKLDHYVTSKEEIAMVALNIYEEFNHRDPIRLIGVGLEKVIDVKDIPKKAEKQAIEYSQQSLNFDSQEDKNDISRSK